MAKNKEELFESYPIPKAVAALSIPTVIACLVMVMYNLADTFFVGKLNSAVETSAVTLAAPVILAFNAVTNLFGMGCSSLMSRALGVKDYNTVRKSAALGFYCSIICGAAFSLCATFFRGGLLKLLGTSPECMTSTSEYLFWTVTCGAIPSMLNVVMANLVRAEGSSVHASVGTMSGCVLNIILDPFFIMPWGLGLGASGAGLATFISNCVACLYFIIVVLVKGGNTYVSMNPKDFRPTKTVAKEVFGVGVPSSVQNILNVTGMTVLNNFMSGYGKEAVAAIGISHKTAMVPMYLFMGITQGVMPLIGYNYSSGNKKRLKSAVRFTEYFAGTGALIGALLVFVFSREIVGMFMNDPKIVEYGGAFLKGAALALPFLFMDFMAVGVFQACGLGKRTFVFAILRKVALEIPAIIVLDYFFPMYGPAYAQLAAELILAAAAFIWLEKLLRDNGEKGVIQSGTL